MATRHEPRQFQDSDMIDEANNSITVAPHYMTLAACLKPLIREIEQVFINKIPPSGNPWVDFQEASDMFGSAMESLSATIAALNGLNEIVFAATNPSDESVRQTVARVKYPLDNVLNAFRTFWGRPFPVGLEQGQYLASAIMERPLRQLLQVLEQVVMSIDDPAGAVARYGTASFDLEVVFQAEEEAQRFEEWCQNIKQNTDNKPKGGGFGLVALLASFLLGRWTDHHDK